MDGPCEHGSAPEPGAEARVRAGSLPSSRQLEADEPVAGNYFVAAYPPFSCWRADRVQEVGAALDGESSGEALGLYIHVPFCQQKCSYCYYLSYVDRPTPEVDGYLEQVVAELELLAGRRALRGRRADFVYFGGGTPSTLTPAQLVALGEGLRARLPWSPRAEVTFECAPRSTRPELVEALRALGATRISLGVQSFDDDLLRANGRIHLREDVQRAFGLLRSGRFPCVNLDLMVGLMGEEEAHVRDSIERAIALEPDSVTVYLTEIPHNTALYRALAGRGSTARPVPWDVKRQRLALCFERLEAAGYALISAYNAVKDPHAGRFRYQDMLWHGADLLGLGVSAFSYLGGVHYQNAVDLGKYLALVGSGRSPACRAYRLDESERLVRELVLQLKLGRVEAGGFARRFGVDILERFAGPLAELEAAGWLRVSGRELHLTRAGLLRVDRLLSRFYLPEHRGVRYS